MTRASSTLKARNKMKELVNYPIKVKHQVNYLKTPPDVSRIQSDDRVKYHDNEIIIVLD